MHTSLIVLLIVLAVAVTLYLLYRFHVKAVVNGQTRAVTFFREGVEHANEARNAIVTDVTLAYRRGLEHAHADIKNAEKKV